MLGDIVVEVWDQIMLCQSFLLLGCKDTRYSRGSLYFRLTHSISGAHVDDDCGTSISGLTEIATAPVSRDCTCVATARLFRVRTFPTTALAPRVCTNFWTTALSTRGCT